MFFNDFYKLEGILSSEGVFQVCIHCKLILSCQSSREILHLSAKSSQPLHEKFSKIDFWVVSGREDRYLFFWTC